MDDKFSRPPLEWDSLGLSGTLGHGKSGGPFMVFRASVAWDFRVFFGDCLPGSGSLLPRRKGSYLGAVANCAALARGNLFRPNKGPRTLYQRMVSPLRPARRDRVGR